MSADSPDVIDLMDATIHLATPGMGEDTDVALARHDPHAVVRLNAGWIVRLRWAAILGQVLTICVVHWHMGIALPLVPLGVLLVLSVMSNLAVALWLRREPPVTEATLGAIMALDLALFTGLLYFTGGPFNPFSSLYLVHLALAALVLSPRWTWTLVAMAVAANAGLFLRHVPLPIDHGAHGASERSGRSRGEIDHGAHGASGRSARGEMEAMHPPSRTMTAPRSAVRTPVLPPAKARHEPLGMHLQGMWVAFGVTAAFIVYFLHRVTLTLARRESELARVREQSARAERLASVATLAAGAAHELSTPLSTIAVVARELERSATDVTVDDARLIREQVDRCRDILSQMAGDAGESPGEVPVRALATDLVSGAIEPLEGRERVKVLSDGAEGGPVVVVPVRAITQALRNVIQNALDASPPDREVIVRIRESGQDCAIAIEDRGEGMAPEVREHATDPFFTTKEPGQGMGLGLFLTRSVLDLLGGDLEIVSDEGRGTTVVIRLPVKEDPATLRGA